MAEVVVAIAALLCALVTGLLLGFAVVAMPGIAALGDREHLRAFQVMDRVIQDRSPLFLLVWVGSVVAVVGAVALALSTMDGTPRTLVLLGGVLWVLGVQAPTAAVNIPLNNAVQALDLDTIEAAGATAARADFEARWNRWNAARTVAGLLATACLLGALVTA